MEALLALYRAALAKCCLPTNIYERNLKGDAY